MATDNAPPVPTAEDRYAKWQATVGAHSAHHGCGCLRYDRGCQDPAHADGHRYHGLAYCPEAQRLEAQLTLDEIPPALGAS